LRLDAEPVALPTTRPAQPPDGAAGARPGFRSGFYSGRVIRRFIDVETEQVALEKLLELGAQACDELLRFELDRSFRRRYDPAGWETFKRSNQLSELEIPPGSEVDIALLVVDPGGRLGFLAGNHPIRLAPRADHPDAPVASAMFSGRQVVGEWHTFARGRSCGVALRFTPREDSGYYSIRSISLSDAREQGLSDDVLFHYGLNIFADRLVVELAILRWRGPPGRDLGASAWPADEFRPVFQEKARRDFGGDQRAFERHLLEMGSFLSRQD
jgi:hypothetical protein